MSMQVNTRLPLGSIPGPRNATAKPCAARTKTLSVYIYMYLLPHPPVFHVGIFDESNVPLPEGLRGNFAGQSVGACGGHEPMQVVPTVISHGVGVENGEIGELVNHLD